MATEVVAGRDACILRTFEHLMALPIGHKGESEPHLISVCKQKCTPGAVAKAGRTKLALIMAIMSAGLLLWASSHPPRGTLLDMPRAVKSLAPEVMKEKEQIDQELFQRRETLAHMQASFKQEKARMDRDLTERQRVHKDRMLAINDELDKAKTMLERYTRRVESARKQQERVSATYGHDGQSSSEEADGEAEAEQGYKSPSERGKRLHATPKASPNRVPTKRMRSQKRNYKLSVSLLCCF